MAVEKPVLTQEQQDAVAALASTNVYAKQSKFKTFRELPPKDKWPYFKQNFLTDVLIIIAVVGLVLAFVISYVTKGPEAELSLEGVDMAEYSEQIDALGADFVKTQGIEDERLVRTDASIAISENAAQDGSASLTARVSAGQINMIVAETDIFAAKGNPVSDVNDAVGFDLSHSKTWTSMKGLPKEGVILGFSNITESKDMPIQFVEYLQFE
ncbi:MAG: hypothetical protein BHV59_02750 [Bifidobacterium sp. 56_9_plus]|nr:MAG: hypothetical protein BHV59_02750 [Bifidobacterium sp. 56_9_plus]